MQVVSLMDDYFQSIKLFFRLNSIDIHHFFSRYNRVFFPLLSFIVRNVALTIPVSFRKQIYKREKEREKESYRESRESYLPKIGDKVTPS